MDRQNQSMNPSKPGNIRLRRMFQSDEPAKKSHIPEEIVEKDLDRIVLKFGTDEKEPMSLVNSLNKLVELSNTTPVDSLFEYIDGLKSLYHRDEPEDDDEGEMDIAELIKQSEAELLQESDQRSLLYDLIRDVNQGEPEESAEHDQLFRENIAAMLEEDDETPIGEANEVAPSEEVKKEASEPKEKNIVEVIDEEDYYEDVVQINPGAINKKSEKKKKRSLSPREKLFLVLMLICFGLLYIVYQEQFHSIFSELFDIIRKMF